MHGAGTVSGLQLVALHRAKSWLARWDDTQQIQQNQRHQSRRNQLVRGWIFSGVAGPGKFVSSGSTRTSMISCSSVSVTITDLFVDSPARRTSSELAKSGWFALRRWRACDDSRSMAKSDGDALSSMLGADAMAKTLVTSGISRRMMARVWGSTST